MLKGNPVGVDHFGAHSVGFSSKKAKAWLFSVDGGHVVHLGPLILVHDKIDLKKLIFKETYLYLVKIFQKWFSLNLGLIQP